MTRGCQVCTRNRIEKARDEHEKIARGRADLVCSPASDRGRLAAEDLETIPDLSVDFWGDSGRLRLVDDLLGPPPGTVEDVAMPVVGSGGHVGPLLARRQHRLEILVAKVLDGMF